VDVVHILILVGAGAAGGFIAGLVGVGGGIIFAPFLFYYFQITGTPVEIISPLTIGTSLFCTTAASTVSAWKHHRQGAVAWRISVSVGLLSFVVLYLVVRYVTTKVWYDERAFELVFGTLLLLISIRMGLGNSPPPPTQGVVSFKTKPSLPALAAIGSAAGGVAGAAGVGGGIILVPAYHQVLRQPMPVAIGTSSATIIFISALGVLTYAFSGIGVTEGEFVFGYVDVGRGLILSLPTLITARLGAHTAYRLDNRLLRIGFAVFAGLVALRMLVG
jgi:uncharacterized membrane protein YfcA